jgi:hypothetical protein
MIFSLFCELLQAVESKVINKAKIKGESPDAGFNLFFKVT